MSVTMQFTYTCDRCETSKTEAPMTQILGARATYPKPPAGWVRIEREHPAIRPPSMGWTLLCESCWSDVTA